jgi:hypothetical protein
MCRDRTLVEPVNPYLKVCVPLPYVQMYTPLPGGRVAKVAPPDVIVCVFLVVFMTVATAMALVHVTGDEALQPADKRLGLYLSVPAVALPLMLLFGNAAGCTATAAADASLGAASAPAGATMPTTTGAAASTATPKSLIERILAPF